VRCAPAASPARSAPATATRRLCRALSAAGSGSRCRDPVETRLVPCRGLAGPDGRPAPCRPRPARRQDHGPYRPRRQGIPMRTPPGDTVTSIRFLDPCLTLAAVGDSAPRRWERATWRFFSDRVDGRARRSYVVLARCDGLGHLGDRIRGGRVEEAKSCSCNGRCGVAGGADLPGDGGGVDVRRGSGELGSSGARDRLFEFAEPVCRGGGLGRSVRPLCGPRRALAVIRLLPARVG
jgi:hypothetical protein